MKGIRYDVMLLAHQETALELMVATLILPDGSTIGKTLISVAYPARFTVLRNVSLILIYYEFLFLVKVSSSIIFPSLLKLKSRSYLVLSSHS